MISIERAKELLNDPSLSDSEVQEALKQLYGLAEIALDDWEAKNGLKPFRPG